jgi:hypothetical protein
MEFIVIGTSTAIRRGTLYMCSRPSYFSYLLVLKLDCAH